MSSTLKLVAVLFLLSGVAWASDHRGRGDERGHHGGYGAPEPVTMVGLALGAGAVGVAAWRKRRKR